jgi:hypothetical protein
MLKNSLQKNKSIAFLPSSMWYKLTDFAEKHFASRISLSDHGRRKFLWNMATIVPVRTSDLKFNLD